MPCTRVTNRLKLTKMVGREPYLSVYAAYALYGLRQNYGKPRRVVCKGRTPRRKPREGELTDEQKRSNRELARRRVVVEHVIRSLKIFRILAERYRNRRPRFKLIAGLYNYGLSRG